MKFILFTALVVSTSKILPASPDQKSAPERTSNIEQLQEKLASIRTQVDSLLAAQSGVYAQLDKVETELELSSKLLRELRKQSKAVTVGIAATRDTLTRLGALSTGESVYLGQLLRSYYIRASVDETSSELCFLESPSQVEGEYLFRRLIAVESHRMASTKSSIIGHRLLLENLNRRSQELESLTRSQKLEEQKAKEAVKQRDRLLASLKGEQQQRMKEIAQIEGSPTDVSDIFAELDAEKRSVTEAVWQQERGLSMRMKGRLFWPVNGDVVNSFGLHRDDESGLSSKSNGIDINVIKGTKVVAAMTGAVLYIGWARGLEKFVVVDHGGSIYSLYGILDQVSVSEGDQVIRGVTFASAAAQRLHFEIRDGKSPVNPMDWLRR